mgnify:CR=1 FL=1
MIVRKMRTHLKSNLKSIHNVSPLVASNGHKLPTEDLVFKKEPCWAYILRNIKNGMWYIGFSTQPPDEYKTSSDNKNLAMAYSRGEIKRYIIKTGYDLNQMKRYESDLIIHTKAEHDPMSYNDGPGIVSKDVLREPNLNMMKEIADGILHERSLMGAKFYTIPLDKEKYFYYPRAKLFLISTNLLIILYLFFNNNYFREVFFIGVVPYLLIVNNEKCLFSKICLSLILFKYFFMILFWPKVMFSDINVDLFAQLILGIKILLDYFIIMLLIPYVLKLNIILFKKTFKISS